MKAKEWAERFNGAETQQVPVVLEQFIREIETIAISRGRTPHAFQGAIREQMEKFRSVASITKKVHPRLFLSALKQFGDDLMRQAEGAVISPKSKIRAQYPEDHPHTRKMMTKKSNPKPSKDRAS